MIHFVGAGPGAEDLITLRGAELLRQADCIVYAGSLVNPALLGLARSDCKLYNSAELHLEEVLNLLITCDEKGRNVVRLHTGDPSLYGAIREQMAVLDQHGISYEVVPGVSAFSGAAAALNAEYTLPGVSQTLILTRLAGKTPVPEEEQLHSLAAHGASMALFLSAGMLPRVQAELLRGAYTEETPAALVYKATWPEEKVVHCTVSTLAAAGEEAGITKTAMVLVGDFLAATGAPEPSHLYESSFATEYRAPAEKEPLAVLSFTDAGQKLADSLAEVLGGTSTRCGKEDSLADWTASHFYAADALVYVGAVGIAVRAIAPFAADKTSDPAVVVLDDTARFAVPILSGHLGGANDLARRISRLCGATPVITTSTDNHGVFAVDEWAKHQHARIGNPSWIKTISGALLAGQTVRLCSEFELEGETPQGIQLVESAPYDIYFGIHRPTDGPSLHVVSRILALGVGCKKGTSCDALEEAFQAFLQAHNISPDAVDYAASIDLKQHEPGLRTFCQEHGWDLLTYPAEDLRAVPGTFTASDFVRQTTGVDNVCERSAVLASSGTLLVPKQTYDGITFALAVKSYTPNWR